jgi:general secretion pathway protein F
MPFYLYSAVDSGGKKLEGTIQAENPNHAMQLLTQRGFRAPRIISERLPQGVPAAAAPVQINVPAAPKRQEYRTRKSTDRDLFFLFAQVSDQLRAGINPAQAFGELSRMYKAKKFRDSLGMIADAASEGKSISGVLELWPDLYPEHVVGLVRAGEMGGFLPEAAATISEQAGSAYKFKRFHWWIWLIALNGLLSIPLVLLFRQWLITYYEETEKTGGQGDAYTLMAKVAWKFILWPYGPATLATFIVLWLLRNAFSSRPARLFRHRLGLSIPVLGGRARNESVTIFTWVLSRLARGGVPPNRSWELALASVPNLGMQERLENAGSLMNEGSRLSDVVFKSKIFPDEYAPAVATGELTGDVSGTLERLSQISRTEFEAGTVKSKAFTGSCGCTALLITTGIVTIVAVLAVYKDLYQKAAPEAFSSDTPGQSQSATSPTDSTP